MEFTTGFKQQVKELFVAELERQLASTPDKRIEQVETTLRRMLVEIGAECIGAYLTAQGEDCPPDYVPCSCGGEAKYHSRRQAMVHSVLGKANYRRPDFIGPDCSQGQSPLDERLGLEPGQVTTGLSILSSDN